MTAVLRRDRALQVLAGISLALIAVLLIAAPDAGATARIYWTYLPFADLMLMCFVYRVTRVPGLPADALRFWRRLYGMGALFFVGDVTQVAVAWLRPGAGAVVANPVQALAMLAGGCWLIWTMLTHPAPLSNAAARVRFGLDAGAVVIGAGVLIWLLLLPHEEGVQPSVALLLSSGVAVFAVFAAVKLVLGGNAPIAVGAAAPMLVAGALQGTAGALVTPGGAYLNLLLAVQIVAAALLAAGPRLQEHTARRDPAGTVRRSKRAYSFMPYTTLAGLFGAMPIVLRDGLGPDGWLLLAGLAATTVLVVTRQLLAFRENAALLEELGTQEQRYRSLLAHSSDITSIADARGVFTYVTPAAERLLGLAPDAMLGTTAEAHVHPDDLPVLLHAMATLQRSPDATASYQIRYGHTDGSWRWLDVVSRNLLHLPGVRGYVSNARDATQARLLQDELRHRATHDALTGLANRSLFDARLAAAGDASAPGTACGVASVLLVDLDGFKAVNDTYGHHAGDGVLVAVAERLSAAVPPGGTAARLGGDEFAVLLPGLDAGAAAAVAQRFLDLLDEPVPVDDLLLTVRASIGIVDGDVSDAGSHGLLRRADAAMYHRKRQVRTPAA